MSDDIGSRMKSYEVNSQTKLPNDEVMFVRVDGKGFHTWTKEVGAERPFDDIIHQCMEYATLETAKQIPNFALAYTQSDEATFMFHTLEAEQKAWFDGKVSKLVSVTASMFTYHFNDRIGDFSRDIAVSDVPAYFDSRAFSIPVEDAANNLVWRQQDWRRNRVQMLGQYHFGHKEMQNKSTVAVWAMLTEIGIKMSDLEDWQNFGTFIMKTGPHYSVHNEYFEYNDVVYYGNLEGYIY